MNDLMTKSFTSYVDLKKEALRDVDLEMGGFVATSMDKNMIMFLEEAERVKTEMNEIRGVLGDLEKAREESKGMLKPEGLKVLRNRINGDVVSVLKKARQIRSQLEDMDRANVASRANSGCKEGSPIDRTRSAVTNGLRKKLKELMMEFQELRQRMMTEYNETIARRYFTVTGEYPNEEVIDKIVSSGDGLGGEELLQRAVQEHGKGKVLETVVEIQDRYDTAKEIEKSLLELHQVFLDMAVMVEAQGEQLDDIHHHVINAANYVSGGANNLKSAKGYQRSSRRCMVIGIIFLLIVVLGIVIPLAIHLS